MYSYVLRNGQKIDMDGCVQAVLSVSEYPLHFLDLQTGNVCVVDSIEMLADWVQNIEDNERYKEITSFDHNDYADIMDEFLENIIKMMGGKELYINLKKILNTDGWEQVVTELKKDAEEWVHAWDQYIHDEAYDLAVDWVMNIPGENVIEKFDGCDDCAICQTMEEEKTDVDSLTRAFAKQKVKGLDRLRVFPKNIFQLKIELSGSQPLVWRRIIVPDNYSFFDLHVAIQDTMPWYGSHLHQFFDVSPYTNREYTKIKYPDPDNEVYLDFSPGIKIIDETKTLINEFLNKEKDSVWYEYDFGDSWMHKVILEKVISYREDIQLPDILTGKNMCPWEDSGGLGGFYEKIEILKNKKHIYHKEILEWAQYIWEEYLGEEGEVYINTLTDITKFEKDKVNWSDPDEELKIFEENYE